MVCSTKEKALRSCVQASKRIRTAASEQQLRQVDADIRKPTIMADRRLTEMHGLPVVLPDARILGIVHDVVLDEQAKTCTHLFVTETTDTIIEGGMHVSIPWSWVRSISDVILLRWFPPTPIPRRPGS